MTSICWKSAVTWSLLGLMFLLFLLMVGPLPALAYTADAVLYEVTEDMYLKDALGNSVASVATAARRSAVAQLSGWAKIGTPLCPNYIKVIAPKAKRCSVNATGADDLSLLDGTGTLGGTYSVVVQGDNDVDAPEFVILTGTFTGKADLSRSMSGQAPLGYITEGVGTIDGYSEATFKFTGRFRLPFVLDEGGRRRQPSRESKAYYLDDHGHLIEVTDKERSLGMPTVRLEIEF
jgi:hypothetical protein